MHAKREILFWTNPAECRHWLQHKRIFFYAVTKRGTWHVWASQLEFSPLASVCLCCVNTKPLSTFAEHHGFGSAYLSFTTCFLFAGRMPVCAHHNHMMLKPTPNIMTASCCISHLVFVFLPHLSTSPFSCLFVSFISLLQFISLSPYSIMSFSYAELSVISRALCATSASLFFFTFLSLPLLLRHSSPTQGHITKLCCHTAFPVRNLFHLCLWTTPTSWQFQSKSHRDALLPKTFLCSHFWMLSGNNFAVAECCLMILVCVILVWEVWMADNRKWTLLNTLRKAFEWLGCL